MRRRVWLNLFMAFGLLFAFTAAPAAPSPEALALAPHGAGFWTYTGSLNTARYAHTATLLSNGRVLVAGGSDSANAQLDTVELYNPATGSGPTPAA